MSIQSALEIREKEALLTRTPLQKFGAVAPVLFLLFVVFVVVQGLFANQPFMKSSDSGALIICLSALCIVLSILHVKNKKRILELEVTVLKLRRKIGEPEEKK